MGVGFQQKILNPQPELPPNNKYPLKFTTNSEGIFMRKFINVYHNTFTNDELQSIDSRGYLELQEKLRLFKTYDKRLNITNNNVVSIIENTSSIPNGQEIKHTCKKIYVYFLPEYHELAKSSSNLSVVCTKFWVSRGYSEQEAKTMVSKEQERRNPYNNISIIAKRQNCSEEEVRAKLRLRSIKGAQKNALRWKREYWRDRGFSESEITDILTDMANRTSSFTIQFWINRGYTEEEAKAKQYKIASNGSLEAMKERYPDDYMERYNIRRKRSCRYGKDNWQFGKPAPKKSGCGISGYYGDVYFRSLFEYFYMKMCERDNISYVSNDVSKLKNSEKVIIPYEIDGTIKNYIPDYIINGDTIVEVKNRLAFSNPIWKYKEKGLQEFIKTSKVYKKYLLIDESKLDFDIDVLKQDMASGVVKIDDNKLKRLESSFKKYEHQIYKKRLQTENNQSV